MTRYFAQNTPRAGLEHMMMSVPGFQKRGGGMMILSRFCYKPEDVDCRYCLHYRRRSCQVRTCPYIAERLKSGAIEYLDLILEYFGHIPHAGLHKRIQAVEHWSGPDQAVLHTVSVHLRSRFADRVWDDAPPGYMSDRLLTIGNTTAALDELYVWLSDNVSVGTTIIEYIRNTLKRVRKKESNLIMASQNLEDFDREGIRELTKPLFAIPPHQFIFNCGSIDKRFYMDLLQLEEAEYNLIRFPQRGVCLFKCGNERYLLEVHAPAYKEALFGTAGGR